MYKRILIPLDGSPLAEQALPHAIAHAEHFRAELILLRVLIPLSRGHGPPEPSLRRAEKATAIIATEYLERIAAGIQDSIPTQVTVIQGRPHLEITKYAEAQQVDLIVMSARGQSRISRWLLGSVSDRVVRGASVPVLLVRARKGTGEGSELVGHLSPIWPLHAPEKWREACKVTH